MEAYHEQSLMYLLVVLAFDSEWKELNKHEGNIIYWRQWQNI